MSRKTLKSTLAAAAVALSFLAAPAAHAQTSTPLSRDSGVGLTIAAQGNSALLLIQAEFKAAAQKSFKPAKIQARKKRVGAPAAAGGSIAATDACAE
ncbi:MAG: hypothetical protein ACT4PK_05980 [Gammaproteobacteria bacterium]